jgi:hypothetical protein
MTQREAEDVAVVPFEFGDAHTNPRFRNHDEVPPWRELQRSGRA